MIYLYSGISICPRNPRKWLNFDLKEIQTNHKGTNTLSFSLCPGVLVA